MKKKIFHQITITIFVLVCMNNVQAQVKSAIIKAAAFYKIQIHGAQMVDENGNPRPANRDTLHWIVLETQSKPLPVIDSVFYFGKACIFTIKEISDKEWMVGKLINSNKKAGWKFQKKNSVCLIEFRNDNEIARKPGSMIKLKAIVNKKTIKLAINKEQQLEADEMY